LELEATGVSRVRSGGLTMHINKVAHISTANLVVSHAEAD
jgi:hypothetical protein